MDRLLVCHSASLGPVLMFLPVVVAYQYFWDISTKLNVLMCNLSWCSVILLHPHTWYYSRSISFWWDVLKMAQTVWSPLSWKITTDIHDPAELLAHAPFPPNNTVYSNGPGSGWWENYCCGFLKCLPLSSPCLNIIWILALEEPHQTALQKHNKDTGNEIFTESRFHEFYFPFITDWI